MAAKRSATEIDCNRKIIMKMLARRVFTSLVSVAIVCSGHTFADEFTYINEDGDTVLAQARLAGSGQKLHALELADGQMLLIPQAAVKQRKIADGPTPIDENQMEAQLKKMFVEERLLVEVVKPFVLAMILAASKDDDSDLRRKQALIKKAGGFLKTVQSTFLRFIRRTRVESTAVRFPLVVLIFESDRNFNQYAAMVTGQKGLSAANIAGFYSQISNQLVLRMSECTTFSTPLHESIHMQVHNRGIFQRLAPVPTWLNEGMATGFEGDGSKVRNGPTTLSTDYSKLALKARRVDWKEIVQEDRAFRGDVFAGEAYGHAWGIHWLLVTRYRSQYGKYVRLMSQKEPLKVDSADVRLKDFETAIGKSVAELQAEFLTAVARAIKRKRASVDGFPKTPELWNPQRFQLTNRLFDLDASPVDSAWSFAKPRRLQSSRRQNVMSDNDGLHDLKIDLSRPIADRIRLNRKRGVDF